MTIQRMLSVILPPMLIILLSTLYSKYDQTFDLLQQIELGDELESDQRDSVE